MLKIKNLTVKYKNNYALNSVNLNIEEGESIGIVGESGSGKTTLCRVIAGLNKNFIGEVSWKKEYKIQFIFQDPYSSINPRMNIFDIVTEPLQVLGYKKEDCNNLFDSVISEVGLPREIKNKYPHQLSGGQRQRVTIARALISEPDIIICDEPISGLDISLAAQILNLVYDLQKKHNFTLIFVSHDISSVYYLTKRTIVLLNGFIIEEGPTQKLIENPFHPYTKLLISSVLSLDKKDNLFLFEKTSKNYISNCPFYLRCPNLDSECVEWSDNFFDIDGHRVRCVKFRLAKNEKIFN